ncbi:DUF3515 domain-containing protein [Nocardioides sp. SR21]|uniref:DUF3515 domain-containing protein n=1 Tax=Nocardioides sp. SR21 TaxID=2919501 RepID=UPI001FAB2BAA|nr:DUF3515 domain-containing protein [Nocardioides sp. SR21]
MSSWTRGVVAFAGLVLLAGCSSGPPEIHAADMSDADAQACRDFVAKLPDTLAGQESVEVAGDTEYGAAWGDPAIVLTCGVEQPPEFSDTSTCIAVKQTGWFVPDEVFKDMFDGDETTDVPMTEMNYRPRVHVDLPGEYRPDGFPNTAGELAELIEANLEKSGKCL